MDAIQYDLDVSALLYSEHCEVSTKLLRAQIIEDDETDNEATINPLLDEA